MPQILGAAWQSQKRSVVLVCSWGINTFCWVHFTHGMPFSATHMALNIQHTSCMWQVAHYGTEIQRSKTWVYLHRCRRQKPRVPLSVSMRTEVLRTESQNRDSVPFNHNNTIYANMSSWKMNVNSINWYHNSNLFILRGSLIRVDVFLQPSQMQLKAKEAVFWILLGEKHFEESSPWCSVMANWGTLLQ